MEKFQEWADENIVLIAIFICALCIFIVVFGVIKDYRKELKADGGIVWEKKDLSSSDGANYMLIVSKDIINYKIHVSAKVFDSYKVGDVYHMKKKHK